MAISYSKVCIVLPAEREMYHMINQQNLIKSHDMHKGVWLHTSTEFTKYFRVTISLNLGVKISKFIEV